MSSMIEDLPRIDSNTCKFKYPVMEDQYMASQWKRVKKGLSFAIIFICCVLVLDTVTAFEKHNGFKPILLDLPILIGLSLSFFFTRIIQSKEKWFVYSHFNRLSSLISYHSKLKYR